VDPRTGWDLAAWHREPLGGLLLQDPAPHDVTGESAEDILEYAATSAGPRQSSVSSVVS
jgi:hypothetical protein